MGNLKIKEWEVEKLINAEYNPRVLKEHQFKQLKDSIERFGLVDPILVNVNKDRHGIIIGGHQRTFVAQSMGMKTVPAIELNLTLEKEKELNIRMNKNQGEWDFESLANFFEQDELIDWGFADYEFGITDEVNLDDFFEEDNSEPKEETTKIILEYTEEEHEKVINALSELGDTPEQAIWKLLKFD
jgi:ParB-like chromosome segregation protein Spo0J